MRGALCIAMLAALSLSGSAIAQSSSGDPVLAGFPQSFKWRNSPVNWNAKDGVLTIRSAEKTDWYIAPTDGQQAASSPLLLFPAPRDFWFSAKLTVDFKSLFDAGALVVLADEKDWVKFAFESPNGKTGSIVSVVTRGLSDDDTGTAIEGNSVYLKVSKTGQAIFLYFSMDGKRWNLTRAFNFGPEQQLQLGFSAKSPLGNGSTVSFSEIHYKPESLKPWSSD